MTTANFQVRRASVEDLPQLISLWKEDNLPSSDLEGRFKEFQVVVTNDGQVLGALGMVISGLEGLLHSEVFAHPEQADQLRDVLWERMRILAQNHGLVRVWTNLATPFWHTNGFQIPKADVLSRLPPAFGIAQTWWLYLQLKEDTGPALSLDKEFALFKEAEREQTEKLFRQARVMKMVAAVLGIGVFILVIVWAFYFMRVQGHLRH